MQSRTADALSELVEMVRDDFEGAAPDDRIEALLASAESVIDEYDAPGQDNQSTVGDRLRQMMAQIVQYINTERPQLSGTMEVERALDVLSNPVGHETPQTSSVASGPIGRATPYAEEQEEMRAEKPYAEMKRDEAKEQNKFVPEAARTPEEKRQEALDERYMTADEKREREAQVEECVEEKGFQAQDAKAQDMKMKGQEKK